MVQWLRVMQGESLTSHLDVNLVWHSSCGGVALISSLLGYDLGKSPRRICSENKVIVS